ncbi:MAG: glutathione S-transferase family protein [Kofleriaceae bacterium]
MYTLHYAPGSSSMAPHTVLEELGVPYQLARVTLEDGKLADPRFLEINPAGKVPALVMGDTVIGESAAICMFLADHHPDGKLAPPAGDRGRGSYYQWMSFLTNTLHTAFMRLYFSARYSTDANHADAIKAKAAEDVAAGWRLVDTQLGRTTYLLGDTVTAPDLFLHMLYAWLEEPLDPASYPNVRRWGELVAARPAVQRMLAQNEMA